MENRIFKLLKKNRPFFSNLSYLSILQVLNILLPILTFPYLIRKLGSEIYGHIAYIQSIIAYFSVIINFGFNTVSTKLIAENSFDSRKINEIFSITFFSKSILCFISLIAYALIILFVVKPEEKYLFLYLSLFVIAFYDWFVPLWFFQGIEKMQYITIISIISKFIHTTLIFTLINEMSDYNKYAYIYILYSFSAIISTSIILRKYRVSIVRFNYNLMLNIWKDGMIYFLSLFINIVKDKTILILIGIYYSKHVLALYDLSDKIVKMLITPFGIISTVTLPKLSREKSTSFIKKLIKILFLISFSLCLIMQFVDRPIILFLGGNQMIEATQYLRLMIWLLPIYSIIYLLNNILIVNDLKTKYFNGILLGGGFFLILLVYLIIFHKLSIINMIIGLLCSEFLVFSYRLYEVKKNKLM